MGGVSQSLQSAVLKEFVAAFWLGMKYFFKPKAT
ncbi:MAG: NADH-quinone oxidoreductase subunit I, partial [Rhodomicrobium sp.]